MSRIWWMKRMIDDVSGLEFSTPSTNPTSATSSLPMMVTVDGTHSQPPDSPLISSPPARNMSIRLPPTNPASSKRGPDGLGGAQAQGGRVAGGHLLGGVLRRLMRPCLKLRRREEEEEGGESELHLSIRMIKKVYVHVHRVQFRLLPRNVL